ncbi:MAG: GNAT family N-acetyltransferase [Tissierellales bacterium]
MIIYKNCSQVELDKIYDAFNVGFSDYIIKFEISKEEFESRFFGLEGNSLEHSFIALDGEKPVGLMLGGIKEYEGTKTLRCGGMCVHPDYRGKGVSKRLFELHKQLAIDNNCKQLFLEVIVGNDRAINFYKKMGYKKVYDLNYYTYEGDIEVDEYAFKALDIRRIPFDLVKTLSKQLKDVHINWQNDFDYMEKVKGLVCYGVYASSELIGALCIRPIDAIGNIHFMWVEPSKRHKGIAKSMLKKAIRDLDLKRLSISFPNNASLHGFVEHNHFEKLSISQYEMYLTLS